MEEKNKELEHVFEHAPIGLLYLDKDLKVVRVNTFILNFFDVKFDPTSKHCYKVFYSGRQADGLCPECLATEALKGEKIRSVERVIKPNLIIKSTFLPIKKEDKIVGVLEMIEDITEQRRAEEKLDNYLEGLFALHEIQKNIVEKEDLPSLLSFIVSKARELTGADAAFFGFVEDDVIVHHSFNGIHTEDFKRIRLEKGAGLGWLAIQEKKPIIVDDFFSDQRLKKAPYQEVEKEGLKSFLAVPFMSRGGLPLGVLYVASQKKGKFTKDSLRTLITLAGQSSVAIEHYRLFEKTRRAYEELQDLHELKNNIISNVSHELLTPTTIVKGAIELLKEEENPVEKEKLYKIAMKAINRQNMIIRDLIEAARLERGELKWEFENVDVKQLITTAIRYFEPTLVQRNIKLKVLLNDNLPYVRTDRKRFQHLLSNLLSNAIKFNKPGGKILIHTRRKGEMIEVSISDSGVGIPADKLDKIFDPLYQVDSSSSRRYGGTGLGLAVAKRIVNFLGGEIAVKSRYGKGSCFYFTLPIEGKRDGKHNVS